MAVNLTGYIYTKPIPILPSDAVVAMDPKKLWDEKVSKLTHDPQPRSNFSLEDGIPFDKPIETEFVLSDHCRDMAEKSWVVYSAVLATKGKQAACLKTKFDYFRWWLHCKLLKWGIIV